MWKIEVGHCGNCQLYEYCELILTNRFKCRDVAKKLNVNYKIGFHYKYKSLVVLKRKRF